MILETLKLILDFMAGSPWLSFFLAPMVISVLVFLVIAVCATIVDTATAIASIFTNDSKDKKK
jgi:hypothetical protein